MIGELAALGAAISWAVAPILYRKALFSTKPVSANIVRCATNAAVLIAFLLILGQAEELFALPIDTIILVVASGIIGLGIGDTLYMLGIKYVGVSRAVPIAATYPLFGIVWATILLGQPLSITAVIGAVVIILGIWLLTRQNSNDESLSLGKTNKIKSIGVLVSLVTAVIWSISIALMDDAVSNVVGLGANYAIITLRIASVSIFFMILAPLIDKEHGFMKMKKSTIVSLCAGGLIANGVGWFLMNYSFQNLALAQATIISSTSPLFATIAGFMLFKEKMSTKTMLGAITIVAGIILIFIV